MLYTAFPGTDLKPSVLSLGTGSFGSEISAHDSLAMLDAYAEAGGNFADSAHIYAAWVEGGAGASERTLGAWLNSRKPDNFIVSTKGGHPHLDTMETSRLSPEDIATDVRESQERLGVETIDLYWLHRDDESIPVGEIMDTLNQHARAGALRYLGASNWTPQRIEAANAYAAAQGQLGFCANQIGWSLAEVNPQKRGQLGMQYMDEETLAWHRKGGLPAVAYSSQANGFFAHPLAENEDELSEKQKSLAPSYFSEKNRARHERAEELGRRLGRTGHEIALAYMWSQQFPAVAIVGSRRVEQLQSSLQCCDLRLSSEDVAFLEFEY